LLSADEEGMKVEEKAALAKNKFHIVEEGAYRTDEVDRYIISILGDKK
jgi:hypothetical protein